MRRVKANEDAPQLPQGHAKTTSTDAPLDGKVDSYNGILVNPSDLPDSEDEFLTRLSRSLMQWTAEGRNGVWLKIPKTKLHLLPHALRAGFEIHHAQKDYVMATHWLSTAKPCSLPSYATHYVGVGGVVVKEKREILVVKEKNGPMTNLWKIPGGKVEDGEEISEAAVREIWEETGIKTQFVSLLAIRQHNRAAFGKADLFFVCRLHPLTFEINVDPLEIAECKWMPIDEFVNLPFYKGVYKKILTLADLSTKGEYTGWGREQLPLVFMHGSNMLFHGYRLEQPEGDTSRSADAHSPLSHARL